jgi:hypothetical protein
MSSFYALASQVNFLVNKEMHFVIQLVIFSNEKSSIFKTSLQSSCLSRPSPLAIIFKHKSKKLL